MNQTEAMDALRIVLREALNRELPLLEKKIRKYSYYPFPDQSIPDTISWCPLNCLVCSECPLVSSLQCKVCGGFTCIYCAACLKPSLEECRQRNRAMLALKLYGQPILQLQGLANCLGVRINQRVLLMSRTLTANRNVILNGYLCPHIRCNSCKRIYEQKLLRSCMQCGSIICINCQKLLFYRSPLAIMSLVLERPYCLPCYRDFGYNF